MPFEKPQTIDVQLKDLRSIYSDVLRAQNKIGNSAYVVADLCLVREKLERLLDLDKPPLEIMD